MKTALTLTIMATLCPSGMVPTGVGTCIDRFEWPNIPGEKPLHVASAVVEATDTPGEWDAVTLCAGAGKRVCHEVEWSSACRGSDQTRYPWGRTLKAHSLDPVCNVDQRYVAVNESLLGARDDVEISRLGASLEPSGYRGCRSGSGAEDMVGNVEEWVRCGGSLDGWCLMGGHAAGARSCDAPIRRHSGAFHYWATGFRCCSDGSPPSNELTRAMRIVAATEYAVPLSKAVAEAIDIASLSFTGVAVPGVLVSPAVDSYLLAATGWYESRWRSAVVGDKGASLGLMQVGGSQLHILAEVDGLWRFVERRELLDTRTSVMAAYTTLRRWKRLCGGPPGAWFTAYRYGRCLPRVRSGGVRRCALATSMMRRGGVVPSGWVCGHEGRALSQATRRHVDATADKLRQR